MIIEELLKNDIDYFCISPGSRSTPLTYAAAMNRGAKNNIFFDERAAAYHALGYACATGRAAVLICTSGTAAANYYPAVIEASQRNIPLLILTADRPPELRDTGTNQTIDQVKLYQSYIRWFFDLPCPTEDLGSQVICSTIAYALARTKMPLHGGPVHINCMFRKPLIPEASDGAGDYKNENDDISNSRTIHTIYTQPDISLPAKVIQDLADEINRSEDGIILLGEIPPSVDKGLIIQCIEKLKWPVFPDILSGVRQTPSGEYFVHYYDQLLNGTKITKAIRSGMVLHLGGRILSKKLLAVIGESRPKKYIIISECIQRNDPEFLVTAAYHSNLTLFLKNILPLLKTRINSGLVEKLINYQHKVSDILKDELEMREVISEISTAQIISGLIPKNWGLFLGNSMPIRDMAMYTEIHTDIVVCANRGTSGIDGTLSSATGFARGLGKPVTVLLGDLALLHDLNALAMISRLQMDMQIVVINNQGGGIFSFLPISGYPKVFERYFAAGHTWSFKYAAKMFNLSYFQPKSNREFEEHYHQATKDKKPVLLEIKTNRLENYRYHKDLENKIVSLIE